MRNEVDYYQHHVLVAGLVVFLMLCMQTILLSAAASSEFVSEYLNKRTVNVRCTKSERNALLDIKGAFIDINDRLISWGSSPNCCQWSGVGCDNYTGHVTYLNLSFVSYYNFGYFPLASNISSSLLHLRNLKYLDLSWNDFSVPILSSIGSLTNLVHLDLSHANFRGAIPDEFGNLSKLNYLDLSSNSFDYNPIPKFIASFTSLTYLNLSYNHFLGAIPHQFGNLSKLHYLDLSNNRLQGQIPNSFGVITGMTYLDLSRNQLSCVIPNTFQNLSSLQIVHFSHNNLSGNLQDLLYLLPKATLRELQISENQLTGSVTDFTTFLFLKEFKVDSNRLNGYLPKFFKNKSVLRSLDLSNNCLRGSLPNFTRFSFLEDLNLDNNKFSGGLPDFTGCLSLTNLLLGRNRLTDWETRSIGQLTNLYQLNLSMNSINSTINEHHLSTLHSLSLMDASFNSLTFNISSDWLPPFNLYELSLASCKLGPKFPIWIQNQKGISSLDFSNTQISDTIPMWFREITRRMQKLDLHSNKIRGTIADNFLSIFLEEIDLSSNYFEGPVSFISGICTKINLSQNKLSGNLLSMSIAESTTFLDLSHNSLFGEVPDSWKFPSLVFLNLGNNNLSGRIPMSIGYLVSLRTLILRNNSLNGELPESLRNCTNLGFVDFGMNSISGTVPAWIGQDLPQLYALVLKSNQFYGSIPYDLCHLSDLRFLDLSMNKISGNIPQCFSNLTAMIKNDTGITDHYYDVPDETPYTLDTIISYVDDALPRWKGNEQEFRRNFAYLKMIDLSSNELTGGIPIITRLLGLNGLNLSRNKFNGKVPVQIGRLYSLENLDLSNNNFSGEIPQSMSELTFLSYLDLSGNNFSGRIPLGSQLQLFNSSTYERNPGLCGLPLTKRCPGDETDVKVQPPSNRYEVDEDEMMYERWLYISAALGFSTTFWGICVTLLLNKRWRLAYFLFLTNLKDRLYVFMAVRIARLKVRIQGLI